MSSLRISPMNDAHSTTEHQDDQAEGDDGDVQPLLELGLGDGFEVEECRESEGDWRAGQGTQDSEELVDFVIDGHGEADGEGYEKGPREVLGPLSLLCFGPGAVKGVLDNYMRWVEHERIREKQVEAKEDDYSVLQRIRGEAF